MKKIYSLFLQLIFSLPCAAQITDDFNDGDFSNNPVWTSDVPSNWVVMGKKLRSNSPNVNSSFYISTPSTYSTNARWEFLINLQFNTSGANYVDVFLTSDFQNPNSAANCGYLVRIGGTADEVSLFKMNKGVASVLINGLDGVTNSTNSTLRIRVIRTIDNTWTLERDLGDKGTYFVEGTTTDGSYSTSKYFCIRIQQSTSGFFNKHFFDDIYAGPQVVDKSPPMLKTIEVVDANQLRLVFNEKLNTRTSSQALNYWADNDLGNPQTVLAEADSMTVRLLFSKSFVNGVGNNLTVRGIADTSGNFISDIVVPFLFFVRIPPKRKDMVITEFMADPNPTVALPDQEFVEIYNRSDKPFDLLNWTLTDGTSVATLPHQIILPRERYILTSLSATNAFSSFGKTVGVSNFPTLNNSADNIILIDENKNVVDSIRYELSWYKDEDKQDGGWSLELIDPENICAEETNWIASEDPRGGTPGKINSVNENKPDASPPKLLSVQVLDLTTLLLEFDEKLTRNVSPLDFAVSPSVKVTGAALADKLLRSVKVSLEEPLKRNELYQLTVSNVRDCAGNAVESDQLTFAIPEDAAALDIVLNEILFNPRPSGVDFLEIYNRSPKYINLKNWTVGNYENGKILNAKKIVEKDFILKPHSYLVFTPAIENVLSNYPSGVRQNMMETGPPSFPDDEGSVCLSDQYGNVVDAFSYSEKFHSPILKEREGVSLERIYFEAASANPSNWRSAASTYGFATPGFQNSNFADALNADENSVRTEPEIISPGVPGRDFTQIIYKFRQGGYVANVSVLDSEGRLIKEIASNETLGVEGFLRWDGDTEDGTTARMGYYLLWAEIVDLNGSVSTFRQRVVISGP